MTVGVLGLGNIGGSVALAAQLRGRSVLAWDPDPAARAAAESAGLRVTEDFSAADVVVLAGPMRSLTDGLAETLRGVRLDPAVTVTDVGSLKTPVAQAFSQLGPAGRGHVGGHPMAGTERSGFAAADPDRFVDARWVLCLPEGPDLARWWSVAALVIDLGARVVPLTPADHDSAMGLVSGLPHLLALGLTAIVTAAGPGVSALAAGSLDSATRVASSDPALLAAVTEGNRAAVHGALQALATTLQRPTAELIAASAAPTRLAGVDLRDIVLVEPDRAALLDVGRRGGFLRRIDEDGSVLVALPDPAG